MNTLAVCGLQYIYIYMYIYIYIIYDVYIIYVNAAVIAQLSKRPRYVGRQRFDRLT